MGIFDFIKGELIGIIEWTDDSRDTLSFRFPDDDKAIKKLTQVDYQSHLMKLRRAQDPSHVYVWSLQPESSSCKVVSIRAPPTNLSAQPPKFGNRLMVQALVQFETMQVSAPHKDSL